MTLKMVVFTSLMGSLSGICLLYSVSNGIHVQRQCSLQGLVKRGEHMKASRMLIRVANNISRFPARRYFYIFTAVNITSVCFVD